MTIEDYFKEPQPVDNEIVDLIFYKTYSTIEFSSDERHCVKILIAHPEEKIWSLGWEINDGGYKETIKKDCTSNVLTKGDIGQLIYGVLRMLRRKLNNRNSSKNMRFLIFSSILRVDKYYNRSERTNDKITL